MTQRGQEIRDHFEELEEKWSVGLYIVTRLNDKK